MFSITIWQVCLASWLLIILWLSSIWIQWAVKFCILIFNQISSTFPTKLVTKNAVLFVSLCWLIFIHIICLHILWIPIQIKIKNMFSCSFVHCNLSFIRGLPTNDHVISSKSLGNSFPLILVPLSTFVEFFMIFMSWVSQNLCWLSYLWCCNFPLIHNKNSNTCIMQN